MRIRNPISLGLAASLWLASAAAGTQPYVAATSNQPGPGLPGTGAQADDDTPDVHNVSSARPPAPAVGSLQVVVQVAEARVYVNGQFIGLAHRNEPFNETGFLPGLAQVRVEADGYRAMDLRVPIKAYEWSQVAAALEPQSIATTTLATPAPEPIEQSLITPASPAPATPAAQEFAPAPAVVPYTPPRVPEEKWAGGEGGSAAASTALSVQTARVPARDPVLAAPLTSTPVPVIVLMPSRAEVPPTETQPPSRSAAPVTCDIRPCNTQVQRSTPGLAPRLPELVAVPGGCFLMGSGADEAGRSRDENLHRSCVADFRIAMSELSYDEYDRFADATGRARPADLGWGRDALPVVNVSWQDAVDYAAWLSQRTGRHFRLPTEAEWEYACRSGGHAERFCGGNQADAVAWHDGNSQGRAHAPDTRMPNALGIYDMSGNVWEWTCSAYDAGYQGGESQCAARTHAGNVVMRGGSWFTYADAARAALRNYAPPTARYPFLGLRLVEVP